MVHGRYYSSSEDLLSWLIYYVSCYGWCWVKWTKWENDGIFGWVHVLPLFFPVAVFSRICFLNLVHFSRAFKLLTAFYFFFLIEEPLGCTWLKSDISSVSPCLQIVDCIFFSFWLNPLHHKLKKTIHTQKLQSINLSSTFNLQLKFIEHYRW